jgi:hypothetical protein
LFLNELRYHRRAGSKPDFVEFLERQGFEETDRHAKEWFYDTEVIEHEKWLTLQQPIGFVLIS